MAARFEKLNFLFFHLRWKGLQELPIVVEDSGDQEVLTGQKYVK
jgi:hypothetical protein